MTGHSACWIYLLAQVTTSQCADWYGAFATCCASLALRIPVPWYSGHRMLDLLTSSGNHRIARIGTVLSLPAVLAYPCACPHLGGAQRMLDLLTSSGNHRSVRIGTMLSLPAVLAYPCACPHLGSAQCMLDLLTSSGNHRSAQVYYRSERGHMRARALRCIGMAVTAFGGPAVFAERRFRHPLCRLPARSLVLHMPAPW